MIQPSTLTFLRQLKANNDRDWFLAHKSAYEAAKRDFEDNVQTIINGVAKFDPGVKDIEARKAVYRIYRDVRFSKNKAPYKSNLGASFSAMGKGHTNGGYYMHIQPGGHSILGGGIWMPETKALNAIRQEIDYHTKEFKAILNNKKFKAAFELEEIKLKTSPKNYPKDHPEIELLKYTSFVAMHPFTDKEVTSKDFTKNVIELFRTLKPLNDFLNKAVE